MRAARSRRTLAALSLAVGCHSFQHATGTRPPAPRERARIVFTPPRDLPVVTHGAPALILHHVARAEGRIMRVRGDTAFIVVEETDAGRPPRVGEAVIVPDANTRLDLLRFSGRRTAALTAGIAAAALGAFVVAYASTPWRWEGPTPGLGCGCY